MNDRETITDAMSRAERTGPYGFWTARYAGTFWTADTKGGLRHLLGAVRRGEVSR